MTGAVASSPPRSSPPLGFPPPDTPGGLAILGGLILGAVYILLLVGSYSALSAEAIWVAPLNLVLGVVTSLFLVSMIGSDRARATGFELDFARTVQAHVDAGASLVEASPLGGILSEYAHAAQEQRRAAREHVYAASPAIYSTSLAVVATLLVGLSYAMGGVSNVLGLALLSELGAFVLLAISAGALAFSVGRAADVPGFDSFSLRRWSTVSRPTFPFSHALSAAPWAVDPAMQRGAAPWNEAASTVPALTRDPRSTRIDWSLK